jgi:hypothetical protein
VEAALRRRSATISLAHAAINVNYVAYAPLTRDRAVHDPERRPHCLRIAGRPRNSTSSRRAATRKGLKLTECVSISVSNAIIESTHGISLNGNDNRSIEFNNVYQEGTAGGDYITFGSSSGIGLTISNCYGGGSLIPYPTNWQNVFYSGNSNLTKSAVPYPNRILTADSGQLRTTTTGGVEIPVTSILLPPGTWNVFFAVQTLLDSGALTLSQAAACLSLNSSSSGLQNGPSNFVFAADERTCNPGTTADLRLKGAYMHIKISARQASECT